MEDVMMFVGPFLGALIGAAVVALVRGRSQPPPVPEVASVDPSDGRVRAIHEVVWAVLEGQLTRDGAKAVLEQAMGVPPSVADRILAGTEREK